MKNLKHRLMVALLLAATSVAATAGLAAHARATLARRQAAGGGATAPIAEVKEAKTASAAGERPAGGAAAPAENAAVGAGASAVVAPALTSAAARNLFLRDGLQWTFGGKSQRGWALYVPLMRRLLGTEADPGTPEFAAALSRWQTSAGLAPSGVLDDATLYAMISAWQSVRIKDRSYPSADQLVVAPETDFYDPTRPPELRQVERRAYDAYKRMVAAAAADPSLRLSLTKEGALAPEEKFLKIISSFRSREYQEQLRKQSPNAGRAGLAVNSPHFTGRALDIYVGGDPVETKDSNRRVQVDTPVYRWLVKNAESFGFRPYYYEPWHWEYVGSPITEKKQLTIAPI